MPLLTADPVSVLPDQREVLEQLLRTHSTAQQVALRARMIVHAAARERTRTRRLAEDGAVLARAVAAGRPQVLGLRTACRCAAIGSSPDVHARANLRGCGDDMREAVGQRSPHQPMEPARNCQRGHTTRHRAEYFAALGGALFKKQADLKPHCIRYWLTPKPDPGFDNKCADICTVYRRRPGLMTLTAPFPSMK
jgi:hypothetical protein